MQAWLSCRPCFPQGSGGLKRSIGGVMRHDWILDVLRDLLTYAHRNDLPALAAQVEQALAVAEVEVAAPDSTPAETSHSPRPGRTH